MLFLTQWMLPIWSPVFLPFLNPASGFRRVLNIWKLFGTFGSSEFMYCGRLAWRILRITLLEYEMSAILQYFEHSLALPFFGTGMKTDLFQSCGHCWVFQICWCIECSTLPASSFRIWNSSAGIPLPPLALPFPGGSDHKESSCNSGDLDSIPEAERSSGEGNGNPLQYSCLENPMDRGAGLAIVYGVMRTWLSD